VSDPIKPQRLTVCLAKPAITVPRDVVEAPAGLKHFPVDETEASRTDLYVPDPSRKLPKWASFFDSKVPPDTFGLASSVGALLTLRHKNRVFAITFGTGRFHLKQDCWEDSFGLRVALNCIGNNVVKSIDKHTLDPLSRHTREQASREATASEFGLDIEQDLLRAVTGTPTDTRNFGKWITGTDTLHLSVPVTLSGVPDLMDRLYAKHLDNSYQKTFPWVDQIAQVRDAALESVLVCLLVQELRSGKRKQTWMAVPEVMTWDNVGGFRFPGSKGPRIEYHDIHITHFLDSLKDPADIDEHLLKSRVVECVDADGNELKRWKVYRCLYSELDYQGDAYLLTAGTWYKVRRNFVKQINEAVAAIPDYEGTLSEYDDASEADYVKRVAKADAKRFAAMDGKTIVYGGGASKIEFCDLLTAKRDLIHIKRYGQSAALSHLFAQGVTSGELFQTDPEFRKALNAKLPSDHRLADPAKRPKQGDYRVVFAIVSDRPSSLVLPFFSRLNLKHAVRRLDGYGFRVAKAKILVSDARAKLQRIRSRKRAA
jgi:uncharacterized protein (TIGR04141 family)